MIVQNFLPKPGTSMHREPPCDPEEFWWTVAAARVLLDPSIHLQAPPNLSDDPAELIRSGIDDWGGVSPVTPDHVNPERPWPALERLDEVTRSAGKVLAPRLTIYPEFVADPSRWLDEATRFGVLVRSDAEGLARDDAWSSGGTVAPPDLLVGTPRAGGPVGEVLDDVAAGRELDVEQITVLFGARGPEVVAIAETADELRQQVVGDVVTFVRNRNINYTNVCTFKCRFCAFSKGPLSLNLRGKPYLLDREEIQRRVLEAVDCGATEVCLQGGIHPDFDGDYYRNVVRDVKAVAPDIHVHGFTALEVTEGAHDSRYRFAITSSRCARPVSPRLPGTAAEVLDDEVRAVLCPDKISTDEWLDAHRTAHGVGLRSNVTLMFGHLERPVHLARHLTRTRALQKETGGFTEFVPLPFVHMASPIFLQHRARPGPTFRETLLVHAVARIAYHGWIDNIQVSWVKTGASGAAQLLRAGANDLGGTLMDENISRAAGADHGQELGEVEFRSIVEPLGRTLEQRTTLYGRTSTSGHRLREPDSDEQFAPSVPVEIRPTPVEALR